MTKRKIFPAILYFISTFLIGIFLALILPASYLYSGTLYNVLSDSLYSGEYGDAMALVGGYYDTRAVCVTDVESGKLVIYEASTLAYEEIPVSEEETKEVTKLQKAYVGFLFGVKDVYETNSQELNETKVYVTTNGTKKPYEILDEDLNDDGKRDCILTFEKNGIVILELPEADYPSIEALTFVDRNGETFFEKTFQTPLGYDTEFYNAVDPLIKEFNKENADNDVLTALDAEFTTLSTYFAKSTYEKAEKIADARATKTIIIYFVVVYVIADLLFTHFIVKFVKFLLFKVFKIKKKEPAMKVHNENFGNDYYCAVTMQLKTDEVVGFSEDVKVTYGEGDRENVFLLQQADGYEKYLRIKAGTYKGLNVEGVADGYEIVGLPETLIVDGYKKTITAKIVRRED